MTDLESYCPSYSQHVRICNFLGIKHRNIFSFVIWKIKRIIKIKKKGGAKDE